jgi:hypothetical protein
MQFIALVQIITANVRILEDFSISDDNVCGWSYFLRASHLINHVIRSGKVDMTTIQCLLLKSLYLLYNERADWAYDEIGVAVRLIFQLRLHDQAHWGDIGAEETSLRQRLFYCIYTLERNISHHLGAPHHINDQDINMDLPQAPTVQAGQPLIPSPLPSLAAAVRWARLLTDVWAAIFRPGVSPVNQEFVAVTEARIAVLLRGLPEFLHWSPGAFNSSKFDSYPHYIVRQAIVMHLVGH